MDLTVRTWFAVLAEFRFPVAARSNALPCGFPFLIFALHSTSILIYSPTLEKNSSTVLDAAALSAHSNSQAWKSLASLSRPVESRAV